MTDIFELAHVIASDKVVRREVRYRNNAEMDVREEETLSLLIEWGAGDKITTLPGTIEFDGAEWQIVGLDIQDGPGAFAATVSCRPA